MSEFQSSSLPLSTSNLSRLIRYGVPSPFPTMSPKESRLLWCFYEPEPTPFDIFDIPLSANVSRLRVLITQNIRSLNSVNPLHLRLWKPSTEIAIDPNHDLAERVKDLYPFDTHFRQLSSAETVGELFPEPHSSKNLHIVVQYLTSLKRSRSPTEEGGRVAKRTETNANEVSETPTEVDYAQRCRLVRDAIKSMPEENLSRPSTFISLPFPSILLMPVQRFSCKNVNNVLHFDFMGRELFDELRRRVENANFLLGAECLYVYGTSGSGKSHLLAALAYSLVREGKNVFYIPDCSDLLLNPEETMWMAFNFAFCGSNILESSGHLRGNMDALISFMSKWHDLYVIVDQINALESHGYDTLKDTKSLASKWLNALRQHRHVFIASANEKLYREADRKQSGVSVFPRFGGMSPDETNQWFTHHRQRIPSLSAHERLLVEHLTGCIPLLLCCLFDLKDFNEFNFKNNSTLRKVATEVDIFYRKKCESLKTSSKETYISIMRNCVMGLSVSVDDRALYDLRYFYVDQRSVGHSTCGIAFESMISLLRMHDTAQLKDDSWYSAVSKSSNPIVRGFLAEQICLSNIATTGLKILDKRLDRMSWTFFDTQPNFSQFLDTDHVSRLYLPTAYNFRALDAIILLLDRSSKKKSAHLYPIQFTLAPRHKDSDEDFHTRCWLEWTEPLVSHGYHVQSTFVWIDKKQPSESVVPKLVKSLRSGEKVLLPEYTVIHIGVEQVDRRLASALGII